MQDFNPTGDEAAVGKFLSSYGHPPRLGMCDEHMFGVTIAAKLLTDPNIAHDPATQVCEEPSPFSVQERANTSNHGRRRHPVLVPTLISAQLVGDLQYSLGDPPVHARRRAEPLYPMARGRQVPVRSRACWPRVGHRAGDAAANPPPLPDRHGLGDAESLFADALPLLVDRRRGPRRARRPHAALRWVSGGLPVQLGDAVRHAGEPAAHGALLLHITVYLDASFQDGRC